MDHIYIHPSVDESQAGSTLPVTDKDAVVESLILFNLVSMTRIQISFLVQCMFQFSTLHLNYEILQKLFKKALVHSGTEFSSTVWSWGHRGFMMLSDLLFHTLQGTAISQEHQTKTHSPSWGEPNRSQPRLIDPDISLQIPHS